MRVRVACIHCGNGVRSGRPRCPACRKAVPRVIGDRFEQRRRLSRDTESVTVHAWDRMDQQDALLRVLLPGAAAPARKRLEVEARVVKQHEADAGFPSLIDFGYVSTTGALYTAQTLTPGLLLKKVLRKKTPSLIIDCFLDALRPVAALHAAGVVHCSISLERLVVTPEGHTVLLDFRDARSSGSRSGSTGVDRFRAPEQWCNAGVVTPATDVFALGVCLYWAFTGRYPFRRGQARRSLMPGALPRRPSEFNPRITRDIDEIVFQALAPNPEDRFASAEEFRAALDSSFGTATVTDDLGLAFPTTCCVVAETAIAGAGQACRAGAQIARTILRAAHAVARRYVNGVSRMTGRRRSEVIAATSAAVVAAAAFLYVCGPHLSEPEHVRPRTTATRYRNHSSPVSRASPEVTVMVPSLPMKAAETTVEFHTWPPARVYVDGKYVVEAPSPTTHRMTPGMHRVRLVPKVGVPRDLEVWFETGAQYMFKLNLETGFYELAEVKP